MTGGAPGGRQRESVPVANWFALDDDDGAKRTHTLPVIHFEGTLVAACQVQSSATLRT